MINNSLCVIVTELWYDTTGLASAEKLIGFQLNYLTVR